MRKKLIALLLAIAVFVVSLPMSMVGVMAEAAPETVPSELKQPVAVIGETVLEEDFDDATAIPDGWKYAKTFWIGNGASVTTPYVSNGALYYDSYMCDAILAMPAIGVADYVYEADLICAESQGSFGLFNNMPSNTNIGVDSSKACLNFIYTVEQIPQEPTILYIRIGMSQFFHNRPIFKEKAIW